MGVGIGQLLLVLLIVLLLFGAGKLPKVMSDLGKGLKAFKSSMNEDDPKNDSSKDEDTTKS
jgi:sec-independent protein translocase protein TatA